MPDGIQDRTVNPTFTLVCRQIVNFTVFAELILAPTLVYVIINYSRQVRSYKYFLLNNIMWCFMYSMLVYWTKAHIRFPAPCMTFAPLFMAQNFPATAMSVVFLGCGLNMAISTAWGLVQRLAFATNGRLVRCVRRHPYRSVMAIVAYHILVTAIYFYAFQNVVITDRQRLHDEFTIRVPQLKYLANTTLYTCVEYLPNTRLYCYLTALVCVFFIFLEFIAFGVLYRGVHRNSAKLSLQTHRMQLVLLRAVAFQLLNYFVIVILPVIVATVAFGAQFEYTEELTTLTETCLTLHGIIDCVCIIYFITPYRRAIGRLVRWKKKGQSESLVVVTRRLNVSQKSI